MKEHLKHFFPFLHKEFRKLEEKELQSEETFKELFPNEPIELYKLRTIYVYQNADEVKVFVTSSEKQSTQKLDRKIIKNAKI
jgi:hypothetical protein